MTSPTRRQPPPSTRQARPPPPPAAGDEQVRQLLAEIRYLESTARLLQSRLDVVTAALSETLTAVQTLEGIRGCDQNTDTLLPIGSGSFAKAKLSDPKNIMIGVGAGVVLEKPLEDSMKDLRVRSSDLEKARTSVTQQLTQVLNQTEEYRAHLSDLVRKKGGGTLEIV